MGDVAERAGMHEHRLPLERLHEVRFDRFLHDHGQGPRDPQVLGGDGLAVRRARDHDAGEASAQVLQVGCEREHRHDLGRGDDHEPVLAGVPMRGAAEPDHGVPQLPVVHVERARPRDRLRVDAELVAVVHARIEGRGEQVVGRLHRMEVAVEVQVDLFHGHDLGVPAAVAAAFDAEDRPHARLSQAEHHPFADRSEPLRQRDARRRLAFAGFGRRDRGGDDELAIGAAGEAVEDRQVDLGAMLPV